MYSLPSIEYTSPSSVERTKTGSCMLAILPPCRDFPSLAAIKSQSFRVIGVLSS